MQEGNVRLALKILGDGVRLNRSGELPGLMTPGSRAAPGVFCFRPCENAQPRSIATDRRELATHIDCTFRSDWNAGAIRASGLRAIPHGRNVSLWHSHYQSDGMLFPGPDRTTHFEPHHHFARLAHGHCRGIFWRLHDIFQFWLGNSKNDGRRRMVARLRVRGGQRGGGAAVIRRRHPACE